MKAFRLFFRPYLIGLSVILLTIPAFGQREDTADLTWSAIADAPFRFSRSAGGVIGDYFYVFGGQPHTRLALAYSFVDSVWIQSTSPGQMLLEPAYCVTDEAIYCFSGNGRNSAEKFTPDGSGGGVWASIAIPPADLRRPGIGCCWDGGDFIYASNCSKSNNPDGYFARYSIPDDSWETLTASAYPRRYAGMTSIDGLIYVIGGIGSKWRDPRICQVYNPVDGSWGVIALHPDSLSYTNSTVITEGTYIWTIGHGAGFGRFPASPHIHYYDPANDTWNQESDLPEARGYSLVGYYAATSSIIQGGGNIGEGNRVVADARIASLVPLEQGALAGTVVDNWYANPVVETEVSIFDENNVLISVDTTNENGSYEFTLDPGVYSALFTKFSYLDSTITDISIASNNTTEVDVVLTFQHQCEYYVGDVNYSRSFNGLDVTYSLSFFVGGPEPYSCSCECTPGNIWLVCCDINADCRCSGLDVTYAIEYFKGGPPPTPCPDCPPRNPDALQRPKKGSTASSSDPGSGNR